MMIKGIGRFADARYGFRIVVLCQGQQQSQDFFAYVAIEPADYNYFKKRYREGQESNFQAFGEELLRGWGTKPPPDIKEFFLKKYDVEFGVSDDFIDRLIAVTQSGQSSFPLKPAVASLVS